MQKEIVLSELDEIVGLFNGISSNEIFTRVKIGDHVVLLKNGSKSALNVMKNLENVKCGTKIAMLYLGGEIFLRIYEVRGMPKTNSNSVSANTTEDEKEGAEV